MLETIRRGPKLLACASGLFLFLQFAPVCARAEPLVVDFMFSSGEERSAWQRILNEFRQANPDISVINSENEQEGYKRDFAKRVQGRDIDVAFWFGGNRLRTARDEGTLNPLPDSVVAALRTNAFSAPAIEAARIDGAVYGFPIATYPWGVFYRKSLFASMGIGVPKTWDEMEALCARLRSADIAPFAVGAREGWPAAAWFDYIDLRVNGYAFHQRLLRGEESFADDRVRRVFQIWHDLLNAHNFLPDTMSRSWDAPLPYLYRKRTAMVLMGGFAAAKFPRDLAGDIGFFAFPRMRSNVATAEDAPLDVLVLPKSGKHPTAARRFLEFLAASNSIDKLAEVEHTIVPRGAGSPDASQNEQRFRKILNDAKATSMFFDRDAPAPLVQPAFEAFQRFLQPPHDVDAAIAALSRAALKHDGQ